MQYNTRVNLYQAALHIIMGFILILVHCTMINQVILTKSKYAFLLMFMQVILRKETLTLYLFLFVFFPCYVTTKTKGKHCKDTMILYVLNINVILIKMNKYANNNHSSSCKACLIRDEKPWTFGS